jgi:hypothetical protein
VSQTVAIFEAKDYSEEDPEIGLRVMSLMNEVNLLPNSDPGMTMLSPHGTDARVWCTAHRNHGGAPTGDGTGSRWASTASRLPHNVIYSSNFTYCIYGLDLEGDTKLFLALA